MKGLLANFALIAVGLLWVIGVDSMPFMKVLGFPMFCLAIANWVKYSSWYKAWSRFIDDGLSGKFNEE